MFTKIGLNGFVFRNIELYSTADMSSVNAIVATDVFVYTNKPVHMISMTYDMHFLWQIAKDIHRT